MSQHPSASAGEGQGHGGTKQDPAVQPQQSPQPVPGQLLRHVIQLLPPQTAGAGAPFGLHSPQGSANPEGCSAGPRGCSSGPEGCSPSSRGCSSGPKWMLTQPRGMLSRPRGMLSPLGLLPNGAVPGPIADVQLTARPHHNRTAGAWGALLTPELHCSLPLGLVHAWKPQLKTFCWWIEGKAV